MAQDIQALASEVRKAMETRTRDDGSRFVCFTDGSPEWMTELARSVHGDMFPDDFVYDTIYSVVDRLEDGQDPDEYDLEPDIYNAHLLRWLGSHLSRAGFVEEAMEEAGGRVGFWELLQRAQSFEQEQIWSNVVQSLRDHLDEEDADTEEEDTEEDS